MPRLPCPRCGRQLWPGYWRWVRFTAVSWEGCRRVERELRIWIRRGRCPACQRSQALLPSFLLERRLDVAPGIGQAVAESVKGRGQRKVAERHRRPHSTVRGWRRRHRARAAELAQLVVGLGP